jgi:hypothetical protein
MWIDLTFFFVLLAVWERIVEETTITDCLVNQREEQNIKTGYYDEATFLYRVFVSVRHLSLSGPAPEK